MTEEVLHSKILNKNGEGTPLIILHGLFGMSDNWYTLGKKYAETRPVYLVDLRNHGDSFHSDEMNLKLMAEDIHQYLIAHNISSCFIMGHSLGGKVTLEFLNQFADLVKKAIVVDILPKKYPPHHQNIIKGLKTIDFKVDKSRKTIDEKLSEYIPEIEIRQFLMKNIERTNENSYQFKINLDAIEKNYISLLEQNSENKIITVPILFIKGENSDYIEVHEMMAVKNNYPESNLEVIADAGHWVHAQNAEDFYRVTEKYLIE